MENVVIAILIAVINRFVDYFIRVLQILWRRRFKKLTALKDIPAIILEHLKVLEGQEVQDLRVTTCYLDETANIWKVNIRYVKPGGILLIPTNAAVIVNNDTGEVTGFWTDRSW